jgi:hypothetical protein
MNQTPAHKAGVFALVQSCANYPCFWSELNSIAGNGLAGGEGSEGESGGKTGQRRHLKMT